MLKSVCNKSDIHIQSLEEERLYSITTNIELNIDSYNKVVDIIKNKELYNLLLKLNSDIMSNIEINDICEDSENIKITFLDLDPDFSSFEENFIHFNNKIIIKDDYNIDLFGMGLYNSSIEYINMSFKYCDNILSINVLFKNTGKLYPYFIEEIKAFMFRKIIYRLKDYIIKTYIS